MMFGLFRCHLGEISQVKMPVFTRKPESRALTPQISAHKT